MALVRRQLKRVIRSVAIIGGIAPSMVFCAVVVVVLLIHARLVVKFHPLVGLALAQIL